ncbi:hypothetical protein [Sodalis sp. (in: enterobacteria)]|uniref:hypothetical protein n=1 Tax=Sodalis sp. (in: enterobacteria) TaxID=1898979 RepID=UPI003F688AD8
MIVNQDLAGAGLDATGQHFRQRRFTGTVFTDNNQRLTLTQGEADVLHRCHLMTAKQARAVAKRFAQIAGFKQGFHAYCSSRLSG